MSEQTEPRLAFRHLDDQYGIDDLLDGHYSPLGHQIVARYLLDWLRQRRSNPAVELRCDYFSRAERIPIYPATTIAVCSGNR